jgi:hypothetical protein
LPDQGFVDLAAGKIEASQIAIDREAGDLEPELPASNHCEPIEKTRNLRWMRPMRSHVI